RKRPSRSSHAMAGCSGTDTPSFAPTAAPVDGRFACATVIIVPPPRRGRGGLQPSARTCEPCKQNPDKETAALDVGSTGASGNGQSAVTAERAMPPRVLPIRRTAMAPKFVVALFETKGIAEDSCNRLKYQGVPEK